VRFLGPRQDLERIYAAADALLLPTRYDAFGLVCLEAAACGLPVVTSAAAGAAELVGKAGAIVSDPEDAAAFAEAMDRLSDAPLREKLGDIALGVAAANDWDAHVAKLRALYRRLTA
jgi:glycosyltransferase involved in cell wall biosynthesis